jgi:hypothetical protein
MSTKSGAPAVAIGEAAIREKVGIAGAEGSAKSYVKLV